MRSVAVSAAVLFYLVTSGSPGSADPLFEPSDQMLAENFLEAATSAIPAGSEKMLRKWIGPVHVTVEGEASERALLSVKLHLLHLKSLTGADISPGKPSNLFVIFANQPVDEALGDYRALVRQFFPTDAAAEAAVSAYRGARPECFGFVGLKGGLTTIGAAALFVPRNAEPEVVHSCVVRQLSRFFGLLGEIPKTAFSVLSARGVWLDLTSQDEAFLRLLYDERLRPGMTAAEALPLIETALKERRANR